MLANQQEAFKQVEKLSAERGIATTTILTRLKKGMSLDDALSKPVRAYKRRDDTSPAPTKQRRARKNTATTKVWDYLLANKTATPVEVIKATGASKSTVYREMGRIGTPYAVFVAEDKAKRKAERENEINIVRQARNQHAYTLTPTEPTEFVPIADDCFLCRYGVPLVLATLVVLATVNFL